MGASFYLSYSVLKGISGISKNKGTSLWHFVPNSGLRKFFFGISIVEKCHGLRSTRWKLRAYDKLDRRRSAKLTVPQSSDARPLVYHSDRQALSTALFRRAGLLASAGSCLCKHCRCLRHRRRLLQLISLK